MAIFLTGFMGTGKSTVGRTLAARLGRPFVDLDAEIERRTGRSIRQIFAEAGEPEFRRLESATLAELAPTDIVLATGGGAVLTPENRAAMRRNGPVLCLRAGVAEILRRTGRDDSRPLLAGEDRESRVRRLLAERAAAYADADWMIDTDRTPVATIVERIVAWLDVRDSDAVETSGEGEEPRGT